MNEDTTTWTALPIHFNHFEVRGMTQEEYDTEMGYALTRAKETMLNDWGVSSIVYNSATAGTKLQLSLQFLTCYEFLNLKYKIISETLPFTSHTSRGEVTLSQDNTSWLRGLNGLKDKCFQEALNYAKPFISITQTDYNIVLTAVWD